MSKQIIVGYLGPAGTFSEQACQVLAKHYPVHSLKPLPSIPHVLFETARGNIQLGLVPVENSIEGTVNITLDMLAHEVDLNIQGEVTLDIKHCLLTKGPEDSIEVIYSHPQALAQCRRFLLKNFPDARCITTESTAQAAQIVKGSQEPVAALGSMQAAQEYGLFVKFHDIADYQGNKTRFLVVGKEKLLEAQPEKTSLFLAVKENRPGILFEILGEFARENIDLTKIESRPTKKELGDYFFFLDCKADLLGEKSGVLKRLKNTCRLVKVLGCYGNVE